MAEKERDMLDALIAEIQRQTKGNWPVELNDNIWLIDTELDLSELAKAALRASSPQEGNEPTAPASSGCS